MSNPPDRIAIVAAQLVRSDRRALSQAWYSALHLAESPVSSAKPRFAGSASAATGAARAGGSGTPATVATAGLARGARSGSPAPAPEVPRAAAQDPRDGRLVRALARLAERGRSAAQTVELAGGRVRLLVRDDGRTTRIVAVYVPELRVPVARAIAAAGVRLAGAAR